MGCEKSGSVFGIFLKCLFKYVKIFVRLVICNNCGELVVVDVVVDLFVGYIESCDSIGTLCISVLVMVNVMWYNEFFGFM